MVLGKGTEVQEGARAVVHYEARWKGVTFMTSRCLLCILLSQILQDCDESAVLVADTSRPSSTVKRKRAHMSLNIIISACGATFAYEDVLRSKFSWSYCVQTRIGRKWRRAAGI